ncbi:hypothetical protein Cgig2_022766 [Carnegiea gigantea]|uniref:DNA-3-methyladenine glycosylase I n=1 Tax=Carnegiea gigantea TaxID=171969 RepID=A0A9Q1QHU7_9CARY|nr:hypothetical protein Cgig2_022766 [Carnegiea gigantea]
MSRASVRKHVLEKSATGLNKEKENPKAKNNNSFFFKHFKKVYPLGICRSNSLLSVSSLSGLSQTSTDSSLTDYSCPLEQKILLSLESINRASSISSPPESEETESPRVAHSPRIQLPSPRPYDDGMVKRCHWITKASDEVYVAFHDKQWGVPVYDDNQLFELLSLCGLLMDYNWTEILKRRWQLREAFGAFDVKLVASMGEEQVTEICSDKDLGLAECRASCIIENAKGILKASFRNSLVIYSYFVDMRQSHTRQHMN